MHSKLPKGSSQQTVTQAGLHKIIFVHCCFAGKCILTLFSEYRQFKVDGSMEKKWDTGIPVDLRGLFERGIYMSVGHERVKKMHRNKLNM
jgi:hypothetical protein